MVDGRSPCLLDMYSLLYRDVSNKTGDGLGWWCQMLGFITGALIRSLQEAVNVSHYAPRMLNGLPRQQHSGLNQTLLLD